ncbi:MAG: cytochrome c [Candidatus Korobacteraceae bacterium]|jgi:mono/diheme cytochrome c family protein
MKRRARWGYCRWIVGLVAAAGLLPAAGCGVRQPSSLEDSVATQVKHRFTVGNKGERNPLPADEQTIRQGQKNFGVYCMVCHGLDGQATGVPFAQSMYPPVPSLNSRQVQDYTDGQLKWIIDNGLGPSGMPASKGILNDDEIWSIVQYIRHLPAKGSLGEPAVYNPPEEIPVPTAGKHK